MLENLKRHYLSFLIESPLKSLVIVLFLFVISLLGTRFISQDFTPRGWFSPNHQLIKDLNHFEKTFQSDDTIVIAYYNEKGIFNKNTLNTLKILHQKLEQLPRVASVSSIFNAYELKSNPDEILIENIIPEDLNNVTNENIRKIIQPSLTRGTQSASRLISKNNKMTILIGSASSTQNIKVTNNELIEKAHSTLKEVDLDGGRYFLYGSIVANATFRNIAKEDNSYVMPILMAVLILILFLLYRSVSIIVLSIVAILLTVLFSIGILGYIGIPYSNIVASVPGILMAIILADIIHLIEGYCQGKSKQLSSTDSLEYSLEKNFTPTILTSITTAVGFVSLATSEMSPVLGLGLITASGTLFAWLVSYVLFNLYIRKFGNKLNLKRSSLLSKLNFIFKGSYIEIISSHKKKILFLFTILFLILAYGVSQNKADSDPISFFNDQVPLKKNMQFMHKQFEYKNIIHFVVDTEKNDGVKSADFLKRYQLFENWLKKQNEVVNVQSPLKDIIDVNTALENSESQLLPSFDKRVSEVLFLLSLSLPEGVSLNQKISSNNRYLKFSIDWRISNTSDSENLVKVYRKKAMDFGLKIKESGAYSIFIGINSKVVNTFIKSMLSALILIFLIVLITYRNLQTAILSIIPNLFAMFCAAFIVYIRGRSLDIGTSIVAAICLGISIDDTIHFISHYHQNLKENNNIKMSLRTTLQDAGGALVTTTILLVSCFSVFCLASFEPTFNLGLSISITLVVALLADLILLPALLIKSD